MNFCKHFTSVLAFAVAVITLALVSSPASSQSPGAVDPSFDAGPIDGEVHSILLQSDGKVIIAGTFTSVQGQPRGRVARLHPDGELDKSFMDGLSGADWAIVSAALQKDGKIVIGGAFSSVNGETRERIARLNTDGSLDESFTAGTNANINTVTLQEDEKILLGGAFLQVNGITRRHMARLHEDGTLDTSFLTELADRATLGVSVKSIAVQPDGKLVVGGSFSGWQNRITRLHPDGKRDRTFGEGQEGVDTPVYSVALQEDGKVLIGGWFSSVNGQRHGRPARLHPDGTLDEQFEESAGGANSVVHALAVQPDGRILVGGWFSSIRDHTRHGIARLNPDGTLDVTFGSGSSGGVNLRTIALAGEEKVMIGGSFSEVDGLPREGVARLYSPLNQPPTDITSSNNSISENEPAGAVVGTLVAADPDEGDTHAFALVSGEGDASNDLFAIVGDRLKTAESLDFQAQSSHTIRIRATDTGGLSVEKVLTIAVQPNQEPTDLLISNDTIAENRPAGTLIGRFTAVDPDENDTHTFSLPAQDLGDHRYFEIDGDELRSTVVFDYETRNSYTFEVRATDQGGASVVRDFTITIERDAYRNWAEALQDEERGEEDDSGGRGIPNLLRYAFAMDPLAPDRKKLPKLGTITATGRGGEFTFLTITYTRRIDDPALRFFVDGSNDLMSWMELSRPFTEIIDEDEITQTVTIRDTHPIDNRTSRFLRLRVER